MALHAGALALAPHRDRSTVQSLLPVTVVSVGELNEQRPNNLPALGSERIAAGAKHKATVVARQALPLGSDATQLVTQDTTVTADNGVALTAAELSKKSFSDLQSASVASNGSDSGGVGSGDSGENGAVGNGVGGPSAYGRGVASAQLSQPTYVQAGYRSTTKPDYPERARKEGKEGRVLLRVLVDEEGRSKVVEVNTSSGSEALDQAALAAIKRWRFLPARYGNKPVESWVKIPIDFRLTDARN